MRGNVINNPETDSQNQPSFFPTNLKHFTESLVNLIDWNFFFFKDVEKFSGQRKEKGIKVAKLCLEKSPHVQHLITHREIYINTVVNFIQDCLNENNGIEK